MIYRIVLFLFVCVMGIQTISAQIGTLIPSNRRVDWRNPGYEGNIPRTIGSFVNVNSYGIYASTDITTALKNLIATLGGSSNIRVLYFPEGVYTLSGNINLKSNIVIKGAGSNKTQFIFLSGGFKIVGVPASSDIKILATDYNSATKTLTKTHGFGDLRNAFIEFRVPNGWWHKFGEEGVDYVGQIVKVQFYTTGSITFVDDIGLTLSVAGTSDALQAKFRKITPVYNVGFEDFEVSTSGTYEDQQTHFTFSLAANCWVSGVESNNPGFHHIGIDASTYIEIRGCYFWEAQNVCSNGQGYGVVIGNHSTNCLVEDNIFRRVRHAMIACTGANRNVFGYNFVSDRHATGASFDPFTPYCEEDASKWTSDILFHGRYPYANLAEGNRADYIEGSDTHGENGNYNTIFRNKTVCEDDGLTVYGGIQIDGYITCQTFNIYGNSLTDEDDVDGWMCENFDGKYTSDMGGGGAAYNDISYYYQSVPAFIQNAGLTWPPMGTHTSSIYTNQTIPAEQRSGLPTKTVEAGPIKHTINYTFSNGTLEGTSNTAVTYLVNGVNKGSNCYGTITGTSFTVQAICSNPQYVFYKWSDGSTANPRTVITSTTAYAMYKGKHISNTATAFSNNSQRKLIQTSVNGNRWLHQVYESIGQVWIEHSSDNGVTWIIGNNGQPLGAGKNPSISFTTRTDWGNNYIGVAWQQPNGSTYTIQGMLFNQIFNSNGIPYCNFYGGTTLFTEPLDSYSINANPNIVVNVTSMMYAVTIERKSTSGSFQPKIYWLTGYLDGDVGPGGQDIGLTNALNGPVNGTDASSTNAAVSLNPFHSSSAVDLDVDFVYQTGSGLKYLWLHFRKNGGITEFTQLPTPSAIGYQNPININPSVVSFPNGEFAASWIDYDVLGYKYSGSSVLNYYGSGVQSNSMNRGGDNSGFIAWSQLNGTTWSNKSILFQNNPFSNGTIQTLSTTGKYVQLANSVTSDLSNMYISSFYPFTAPYYFNTPTLPLSKEPSDKVVGKGFAINKGDISFSYCFEDLNVDGVNVGFIESPDSLDYSKIDILNNGLMTEPFQLKADSKLIFTERSGFADPTSAAQTLGESEHISYKVELIDNATGKVVGTFRNINLFRSNTYSYKTPSYKLNLKGLGGKMVKAKITLMTNLVDLNTDNSLQSPEELGTTRRSVSYPKLVLVKSINDVNQALTKSSLIELSIDGSEMPTTYALEQNYPNPFNPSTTIRYQLPKDGMVTLKIYDVLGREVITLVNEYKTTGRYTATFNASELSSGLYIYRFVSQPPNGGRNDVYTDVKKMLMIK